MLISQILQILTFLSAGIVMTTKTDMTINIGMIIYWVVMVLGFIMLIFVISLLCFHFYLMYIGMSTYKFITRTKVTTDATFKTTPL